MNTAKILIDYPMEQVHYISFKTAGEFHLRFSILLLDVERDYGQPPLQWRVVIEK